MHAYRRPQWAGKTEPQRDAVGSIVDGHFLHTAADRFRITNGQSDMVVTTLLPRRDNRIVRTIGGKGHDFEVDGINYGPTEATYALLAKRKNGGLEGVGGWRIEVAPKHVAGEVHFLHVLQVGDSKPWNPAKLSLVYDQQQIGVRITTQNKTYQIGFNATGPTGGHIQVFQSGTQGVNEPLATSVEDNYQCWQRDPRYDQWMTNPYMQAVIFPYGKKTDRIR